MGKATEKVTLPQHQESDLVWFFGSGQSAFERSTCGSMLEALERDSCVSKACARCSGQGIIGGDDFTAKGYGDWCDRCKGTGTLPVASKRSKHALTAKPKTQSHSGNGKTPDDRTLTKYASVSRRINRLQEINPVSVQVLAAFCGNAGTRWAQTENYSRIFPVLSLTQAGATLLKRSQNRALLVDQDTDVPKDAHEQIGQLHLIQKVQPDANRGKLFALAFDQAEALLDKAVVDYLKTEKR